MLVKKMKSSYFQIINFLFIVFIILGCSQDQDNADNKAGTEAEGPVAIVTFTTGDKCHFYDWKFLYEHEYHERGETEDGTMWMRTDPVRTKEYDTTLRLNRSDIGEVEFSNENLSEIIYTLDASEQKAVETNIRTKDGNNLTVERQNSVVLPQNFEYFWPDRSRSEISIPTIVLTAERIEGDSDLGCAWLQIAKSRRNIGKPIKRIEFLN